MSESTFLETLLDGTEVEWKPLGEVFHIAAGGDKPKEAISDVETEVFRIPILSNGIEDKSLYGWTNRAKINQPSLTVSARGTIGWTSYRDRPFFPIIRLLVLTPKLGINLKYAYYFMKTIERGYKIPEAGIPQLTKPMIKGVQFPIPCPENPEKSLATQAEIVRILDTFTELTAELTARKKQYNYYRDQLLTFEEGAVETFPLHEIAHFRNGKGHEKIIDENGSCVVVNSKFISTRGAVRKYSSEQLCPLFKNDILMVMSDLPHGKALAKCFLVDQDDQYTLNQRIGAFSVKDENIISTKFLFYILDRNRQLLRFDNGADQTNLRKGEILSIKIPVPSKDEQARIVAILDKFDTLTHSISEGLPREIELRQKQYEYYRDVLLNFPKPEPQTEGVA